MRFGSLFSGIGGIDLGLERAGMECAWQSEIEPYACQVLKTHWPSIPNLGDITTIQWQDVERVDLVCGGFPCQDISSAGLKIGITGKRSGLWKSMARAVGELRPRYVLVENVSDLAIRGLDVVLGDLHLLGYDAEWSLVPACALGAPHPRRRLFVLAHSPRNDEPYQMSHDPFTPRGQPDWKGQSRGGGGGQERQQRWIPEPQVDRVAHGIPARLVSRPLGRLGNAVVPQVVEWIGQRIMEADSALVA